MYRNAEYELLSSRVNFNHFSNNAKVWLENHVFQTWELARKERHSKVAFGTLDLQASTSLPLDVMGSLRAVPSVKFTSSPGNFTAAIAGIIILLAAAIYMKQHHYI